MACTSFWNLGDFEAVLARGGVSPADIAVYLGERGVDLQAMKIVEKGRLNPAALAAVARQGATLVMTNVQRQSSRLWQLARDAEDWLADPVTIGAIASFGNSNLKLHYDPEDLLVVQVAGSKRWFFHGEAVADSARSRGPANEIDYPETLNLTMAPGDLLYVPAGLRHRCQPQGVSLHLGMLVAHMSGRDMLIRFLQSVRNDPVLNEPVQRFIGSEQEAEQAKRIKARMTALLEESDPVEWINAIAIERAGARPISLDPRAPD
jgi:ribosomal protein L16 Arg81 hydroxylase